MNVVGGPSQKKGEESGPYALMRHVGREAIRLSRTFRESSPPGNVSWGGEQTFPPISRYWYELVNPTHGVCQLLSLLDKTHGQCQQLIDMCHPDRDLSCWMTVRRVSKKGQFIST
jgi:hypothetical protein